MSLRQESRKKTQHCLFPKVRAGGQFTGAGAQAPKCHPTSPSGEVLEGAAPRTRRLPAPPPPPVVASLVSRLGRAGSRWSCCSSILHSGVAGTTGPSERRLEVGVQDGLSVWGFDVVGSLLKLQQHGHLGRNERGVHESVDLGPACRRGSSTTSVWIRASVYTRLRAPQADVGHGGWAATTAQALSEHTL